MARRHRETFILIALTLAGLLTRLYGIGSFPLFDDEVTSFFRGLHGDINNMYPATDFLILACFKLIGTSEFALRLPLALFGVLSIPAVYVVTRRLFGSYAGLSASAMLLFSYYHLDHSQLTRYYTGTFFFGALAIYYFLEFFETGRIFVFVRAAAVSLCGLLFHPTFVVLPFTIGVFALLVCSLKSLRRQKTAFHAASITLLTTGIGGLITLPFSIPVIEYWIEQSESLAGGWGYDYFRLALQTVKYFSMPVCAAAAIGTILLFRENLLRGLFITLVIAVPIMVMLISSSYVDMRPDYIFAIFPVFFIAGAKVFAFIRKNCAWGTFLSTGLLATFLAFLMPEFVSNYTGKASLDVRKAVHFIDEEYREGDKILSFLEGFNFYMEGKHEVEPYLGTWYHSGWDKRLAKYLDNPNRLWIVYMDSRDGVNPGLKAWLHEHAQLKLEISDRRFDYTFRSVRVYLME